ncbi:nuclear transport factor 2 family protein [Seonamhaeicola sp.]|uniref:nuclear transport factor 2 family protein n=1 Tax=Seonamhaeicola sp. TaxID=1912245 RepID=UPI00262DFC88|nr:nuclear transport factor 2 family protein [Seonamhaeicola sp.]
MKRFIISKVCICMLFISANGCLDSVSNKEARLMKEKMALVFRVSEFNEAFKHCDIATLESMLTEHYKHTNGTSKPINKSDWLGYLEHRKESIDKGELVVTSYEMKEPSYELFGDTAILTARIVVSSVLNGETQNNEYRVTNIWVKEDGLWKRAGFHDGKIK